MASEKQVRSNFSSSVLERALAQDGGMLVGEFSLIQTEFARQQMNDYNQESVLMSNLGSIILED